MSASRKKMIDREQRAAALTERQKQEAAEAKKLKLYSILFMAGIVLMIAIVIATSVISSGIIERNTTAITINGEKVSTVELNYFYIDTISNFMESSGAYASMLGLDTTKPLNEQVYDSAAGTTWADYFLDTAISNAQASYALYNDAKANGYELADASKENLELSMDNLELYAMLYGHSNTKSYLTAMYGRGANEKSFEKYMEIQFYANDYYADTYAGFTYTEDEIRAKDEENPQNYSSWNYNYYYLAASKYYEGGTENENGTLTYSKEEKAAAAAKAEADAKKLTECKTVEEFDAAIAALEVNADSTTAVSTDASNRRRTGIESALMDWVLDDSRKEGDMTYAANSSTKTDDDGKEYKEVNGYYIARFRSVSDNTYALKNVRHILVNFAGGTTESNGITTYSDEEKAAAKAEAQAILDEYLAGEQTAEAFGKLAESHSTDNGSNTNGGLYEDVYPGQMVDPFEEWAYDESRKVGDTGLVESTYGWHVMYFDGDSENNYRDYMITNDLRANEVAAWETKLTENSPVERFNTSKVNGTIVLSSGT